MKRGSNAMSSASYDNDQFLETKWAIEESYWDIDYQIEKADERYAAETLAFADEINSIPGQPFVAEVVWEDL